MCLKVERIIRVCGPWWPRVAVTWAVTCSLQRLWAENRRNMEARHTTTKKNGNSFLLMWFLTLFRDDLSAWPGGSRTTPHPPSLTFMRLITTRGPRAQHTWWTQFRNEDRLGFSKSQSKSRPRGIGPASALAFFKLLLKTSLCYLWLAVSCAADDGFARHQAANVL